ncbi:mediator complex, subunit Med10 [Xylariomycetidae sp. FL2044]|nr:mediator complex, subunit Med10 [Xylariomycetidae sp. FL2044]KAH9883561.1 mediator complex, subunit Med10 [Xylariomycetidae sp. FL2044]
MAPIARVDQDVLEQNIKDAIQSFYQVLVQVNTYDNNTSSSTSNSTSTPLLTSGPTNPNPNNLTSPITTTTPSSSSTTTAYSSRPSRDVIAAELTTLSSTLRQIHRAATAPTPEDALPRIPPELIQYVDNGRNPDIYTREFVELVRRGNQLMRGKQSAFADFRDALAGEMDKAMPELVDDAARVVAATTGAGGGGGGGNRGS